MIMMSICITTVNNIITKSYGFPVLYTLVYILKFHPHTTGTCTIFIKHYYLINSPEISDGIFIKTNYLFQIGITQ